MKTLLIADDSQSKIDLIRLMLVRFGWDSEPVIAMTTQDAMDLIDECTVTHAFVDFYIPTQNGPAIIAKLKAVNPAAHVVLVSSSDKASNIEEAKLAGAEASICTSYQADSVEQAFGDILRDWLEAESRKL